MECMRFFSKRFHYIATHLEKMSKGSGSNRKLTRLIFEHNRVHYDLIQINAMFKSYVGYNLIFFFLFGVQMSFVELLDIDWRLLSLFESLSWIFYPKDLLNVYFSCFRFKLALCSVIVFLYLIIIYFPFVVARSVRKEVNHPVWNCSYKTYHSHSLSRSFEPNGFSRTSRFVV